MDDYLLAVNAAEKGTPQAIVILFGWLGSKSRHVQKYAQLYQDRNCSTIHGVANVASVLLMRKDELSELGLNAAKEAIKLLKASEDSTIPVIIHVFSGAGCILLEQLELLMAGAREAQKSKSCSEAQSDLLLLYEGIQRGGEVFDSSPAYLAFGTGIKAIAEGIPNRTLRFLVQVIYVLFAIVNVVIAAVTGEKLGAEKHWAHILESDIASRQAYIYSTADQLTDYVKVEEVIECRKQRQGSKVIVKRFANSRHCAHLTSHPKEYQDFIDEFISSIKEQKTEEKLLDEDPDMTDYQLGMD